MLLRTILSRSRHHNDILFFWEDAMTTSAQPPTPAMADYEQASKQGDTKIAAFDEDEVTLLRRLQHFLHVNPTAIPAIVR